MSTSIVLNSESFATAADAFRTRCSVPILIILAEDNNATDTTPPNLAFKVPETSILSAVAKPVLEGFRRFLPEPSNAPLFWLSQESGGKEPVSWAMPVGLFAQMKQHEHDEEDRRPAAIRGGPSSETKSISQINANEFKKTHITFPIKLYANFRVTKRGEVFPFHASHMNGSELVAAMSENALHSVKRSVAIMNPESYKTFLGKLNPQDMEALYDFCMMDSVSLTKRTALARFHKDILATIEVQSWPIMIHSMESGRTMTLAIPAKVLIVKDEQDAQNELDNNDNDDKGSETSSGSPFGSPVIVMGIQGQFIAHRELKKNKNTNQKNLSELNAEQLQQNEEDNSKNLRPTTFGDVVKTVHHKMNPHHLDPVPPPQQNEGAAVAAVGTASDASSSSSPSSPTTRMERALDLLRRRMIVGGLPDAPLEDTPLRWLMEHMVGADLALHVLLLPPNHHTD